MTARKIDPKVFIRAAESVDSGESQATCCAVHNLSATPQEKLENIWSAETKWYQTAFEPDKILNSMWGLQFSEAGVIEEIKQCRDPRNI